MTKIGCDMQTSKKSQSRNHFVTEIFSDCGKINIYDKVEFVENIGFNSMNDNFFAW